MFIGAGDPDLGLQRGPLSALDGVDTGEAASSAHCTLVLFPVQPEQAPLRVLSRTRLVPDSMESKSGVSHLERTMSQALK